MKELTEQRCGDCIWCKMPCFDEAETVCLIPIPRWANGLRYVDISDSENCVCFEPKERKSE